ncbi:uncharacterized protein T551_02067 [Pneumocystis jirovecii RU7]|uniref:Btz domain-containing protein n=1 Tax=Pneumocystis jirovecii (strain RU7) TaxID=1408657 RepID=A0A0W4ZM62_PNEJ7|nr:uncharacterized protein T551_02067 [Pneumocystis jirovecii RU7]KTW29451.1 hypothetical protein T551_02067 [Pneumocystis jirovecii RU7]
MVHCLKPRRQREIDILYEDGETSGTDETSYSELSKSNDGIITDDDDTEDENAIISPETLSCNESSEKNDKHDSSSQKQDILLTYGIKSFRRRQKYFRNMSPVLNQKSLLPTKKNVNNSTMFNTSDIFEKKVKTIQKEFRKKKNKKEKVIQSESKNYQKPNKADPTFVPYIGSFFMHDKRHSYNSFISHKKPQYFGNSYSRQRSKWKNSHTKSLQDDVWTHDAFEINDEISIEPNKQYNSSTSNTKKDPKNISKHRSRIFNIRVKISSSNDTKSFQKELTNHFNPLFHRLFLREDKPVKIKFPNSSLKIAYPAPEHSFKFVPKIMQVPNSFNNSDSIEVPKESLFTIQHTNSEMSVQNPTLNNFSSDNQSELDSYLQLKNFPILHGQSKNVTSSSLDFHTHNDHPSLVSDMYKHQPVKGLNVDLSLFSLQPSVGDTLKLTNDDKTNTQQVSNENASEIYLPNSAVYSVPFHSDYRTSQQPLFYYFSTHSGHSYLVSYYNAPSQYNTSISSTLPSISTSSSNTPSMTQDNNAMIYYYDPMQYYYSYSTISTPPNYIPSRSESIRSNHISTKFPVNSITSYNSHRNNSGDEQGMCYYPQGYIYYTNEVIM